MISSLIERPRRGTCHHPSSHNRGEATGTWITRQIEDIPSIISIHSASNRLIALRQTAKPRRLDRPWVYRHGRSRGHGGWHRGPRRSERLAGCGSVGRCNAFPAVLPGYWREKYGNPGRTKNPMAGLLDE